MCAAIGVIINDDDDDKTPNHFSLMLSDVISYNDVTSPTHSHKYALY